MTLCLDEIITLYQIAFFFFLSLAFRSEIQFFTMFKRKSLSFGDDNDDGDERGVCVCVCLLLSSQLFEKCKKERIPYHSRSSLASRGLILSSSLRSALSFFSHLHFIYSLSLLSFLPNASSLLLLLSSSSSLIAGEYRGNGSRPVSLSHANAHCSSLARHGSLI
jgi:hypothetical protein